VAVPDVVKAAQDADILIFVLPHQFIRNTCKPLVGNIKPGAFGLSLVKVNFIPSSNYSLHVNKWVESKVDLILFISLHEPRIFNDT